MIKVLGLALYGPLAASTRYRLEQYAPGLASQGIDLQICHLLDDEYLRRRFRGGLLPIGSMLRAGLARFVSLWRQHEYDVAILHCELFPLLPGWVEQAMIRIPYVYDFDDAFYLKYRSERLAIARPLLGSKFDAVIAGAAVVTAGNHALTKYAKHFNEYAQYFPTVVDTSRYLPQPSHPTGEVFRVGWIGSPSTAAYLIELIEPLSIIGLEGLVQLVVIGGRAPAIPNVKVIELGWDESTELELINSFHVGVMPLPDDDWARGKCAFKLIQYMACAVPVIASRVGANVDVVTDECGLLVATPKEWIDAFRLMRDHPLKRSDMGQAGRQRVVQHYSLERNLPLLASVLRQVAAKA